MIGGALGNAIDRVARGMVADFFSFHLGGYYWPAFNVADMVIVVGVGVLIGFIYWVVLALARSLGETGTLHPLLAAWAANGLYVLLGAALFLYSD